MEENRVTAKIVDAAVEVHRHIGPGLLESVYSQSLRRELELRGIGFRAEVPIAAHYKGLVFEAAYRLDLVVEDAVVVELKAAESLLPVHRAQLLSYLRLTHYRIGLLINFYVPLLKDGIRRIINNC